MTGRRLVVFSAIGALVGLVIALVLIGALAVFDVEASSAVVGAIAGATAGVLSVAITQRIKSIWR